MLYVFAYIQIDLQHQRDNEKLTYLLDSCRPGSLQTLFMIKLKSEKQITFEYMIAIYPTYKGGEACNRSRLRDSPLVRRSRAKEGRLGPTVSYGELPALAGVPQPDLRDLGGDILTNGLRGTGTGHITYLATKTSETLPQ